MTYWPAPTSSGPLTATVRIPGSKSLTARTLILAALAEGPSVLLQVLRSRDTDLMASALRALGTRITVDGDDYRIDPGPLSGNVTIECGLAGTVMRFVPPVAALTTGAVLFAGDDAASARPMTPVLAGLRELGIRVEGDGLPFIVQGTGEVAGGTLQIDASASSQFVSALLLAAPRFTNGLTLRHVGEKLPSRPHIEMTLACLRSFGATATTVDDTTWRVEPGGLRGTDFTIEPDLSNAAPFLAAALIAGGTVRIAGWPTASTQPGLLAPTYLEALGAQAHLTDGDLIVSGDGTICGADLDLSAAGELAPTIAAVMALGTAPSRLRGIGHLRGHETDRLAALETEINRLGGDARQSEDGLIINPAPLRAGQWRTYQDHRMATAGALIGLAVPGVEVENIATVGKTLPTFTALWEQMLECA